MNDEELTRRKRRIRFRAAHRGTKEMDLLLGGLAEEVLDSLDEAGVAEFERLIEMPDQTLLEIIAGDAPAPAVIDGPLLRRLRAMRLKPGSYGENL